MKSKFFLIVATIMMLTSCGNRNPIDKFTDSLRDSSTSKEEKMSTSRVFYEGMLDYFCTLYYKEAFDWKYKKGSIVIGTLEINDNRASIEGQHDYESDTALSLRKRDGRPFKATVIKRGKDEYEITFEKRTRKPFRTEHTWEYTTKTITYSEK